MNYLEVNGLAKSFTLHLLGGKRISGFSNVSFGLRHGEFLGVLGAIGTGKSSLMKCLYRTYLPSAGEISLRADGTVVDLARAPEHEIIELRKREIGFISQSFRKVPRVSALDVVAEPLLEQGVALAEAREKSRAMLTRLHIPEDLWDTYPANLGVGEGQRVNFARTLVYRPRLLILDEPTSLLDVETLEIIVGMFHELKNQGVTIVGAFQETEIVRELADKVLLLEKNHVAAFGTAGDVLPIIESKTPRRGRSAYDA